MNKANTMNDVTTKGDMVFLGRNTTEENTVRLKRGFFGVSEDYPF